MCVCGGGGGEAEGTIPVQQAMPQAPFTLINVHYTPMVVHAASAGRPQPILTSTVCIGYSVGL